MNELHSKLFGLYSKASTVLSDEKFKKFMHRYTALIETALMFDRLINEDDFNRLQQQYETINKEA